MKASASSTPSSASSSVYGRRPCASPSSSARQRAVNSGSSRPSAARCPASTSASSHSKRTSVFPQSKKTASSTADYGTRVARKLLWASLLLAPITVAIDKLTSAGDTTLFVLSALSLIPPAWLIGEATEHAAEHTGPGIGGFLNASFGNAPELIVALFAIGANLPVVVRGSLSGSDLQQIGRAHV